MKKINFVNVLYLFILFSFVISSVFIFFRILSLPETATYDGESVKSDYYLMLAQCILGIIVMFVPSFIEKRFEIIIPSKMLIVYAVFLYCAIILGEVRNFYYNIEYWDTLLHTFSGGMLGALGFSLVSIINNSDKTPTVLSPIFVCVFAFSFAVTLGVFWEIYEYTFDGVLGLNMQKFALEDGTNLIGRSALSDTMADLIVDGLGALFITVIGYIGMKTQENWLKNMQLKSKWNYLFRDLGVVLNLCLKSL